MRLVTNVKKVLPIAKEARMMLIETTEYLETLPDDKAKAEHMKRVEQDIFKTYKPKMKKLTYSQGKLLIKLIDRECHSSSYDMIKAGVCLGIRRLAEKRVRRSGGGQTDGARGADGGERTDLN